MARYSDKELAIARVYAAAMIQQAQKLGEVDVLHRELQDLAGRLDEDELLRAIMTTPTVDAGKRTAMIERMFRTRYSDVFVDSLQVLNRKGRLDVIAAVCEAFREARDDLQGRIQILVRSAAPISEQSRDRILSILERVTGKSTEMIETVDPAILGGLVIQVSDRKLDTSVLRKLAILRQQLLERASREIHGGRPYFDLVPE